MLVYALSGLVHSLSHAHDICLAGTPGQVDIQSESEFRLNSQSSLEVYRANHENMLLGPVSNSSVITVRRRSSRETSNAMQYLSLNENASFQDHWASLSGLTRNGWRDASLSHPNRYRYITRSVPISKAKVLAFMMRYLSRDEYGYRVFTRTENPYLRHRIMLAYIST